MGWHGNSLGDTTVLYLHCGGGYTNVNICQISSNILKKGICTLCKTQLKKIKCYKRVGVGMILTIAHLTEASKKIHLKQSQHVNGIAIKIYKTQRNNPSWTKVSKQ